MKLSRLYTRTRLDLLFATVALIAAWLMLSASEDPIMPGLRGTSLAAALGQFETGNKIIFDLSSGVLSAIGMFYVLVRLPEYERKNRVKRHLRQAYRAFKTAAIQIFVGAVEGSYDSTTVEQLNDPAAFKAFFKQPFVPGQDRWDGVANRMDEFMLRQLVLEAEVLQGEFQHALDVIDIRDPEVFSFIKRMSETLLRAKHWSADYDGTKDVLQFFWRVLAGWNRALGYDGREHVLELIDSL